MSTPQLTMIATRRLTALVLLVVMLGMLSCAPAPHPRTTPLTHSAYVWRQGWNAEAVAGLADCGLPEKLSALNVLVGECGLSSGRRAIRPPWKELSGHGRAISLSVRIGTRKAIASQDDVDLSEGFGLLLSGLAEAKAADVEVKSLQIDFDCPERLLRAYADEIKMLKTKSGGLPLTITTLPAWLDADGFDELIKTTDGWTLQLHGTSRPKLGRDNRLFSAELAETWTRRAMRFGRPFNVAVPTYAYLACFGKRGEYLGMRAEQSAFPAGTVRTLQLPADPAEVARFLGWLDDEACARVVGVDWFRLPLPGDRQNWTMKGLEEVIAGRMITGQVDIITEQRGGLYDISVRNRSERPLPLPSLHIGWEQGDIVGADATYAWLMKPGRRSLTFAQHDVTELLGPGESRVVGWLRLTAEQSIITDITE
jgi:hypothetical protein